MPAKPLRTFRWVKNARGNLENFKWAKNARGTFENFRWVKNARGTFENFRWAKLKGVRRAKLKGVRRAKLKRVRRAKLLKMGKTLLGGRQKFPPKKTSLQYVERTRMLLACNPVHTHTHQSFLRRKAVASYDYIQKKTQPLLHNYNYYRSTLIDRFEPTKIVPTVQR